jgi:nitrite reductase/ring-hydroxylating ferredoxin subunit
MGREGYGYDARMHTRLPPGNRAPVRSLAGLEALDAPAHRIGSTVRRVIAAGPVKDALSGSWLGHALHPALNDVTMGAFGSAVALDWIGGREAAPAARRLIGLGLLSAAPSAASGYTDWADTEVGDAAVRRIGLVHAASNLIASSLFAASWLARRGGGGGRALALAGGAALAAGGYLGGHLTFAEGVGVDRTKFEDAPEDWTDVLAAGELGDGEARCVEAEGTPVLLARSDGELYALSDRCSHRGGPLHEGEIAGGTVTCPWHHSVFALEDGALVHGPAAYPQPAWDVRVREGRIEVRRR